MKTITTEELQAIRCLLIVGLEMGRGLRVDDSNISDIRRDLPFIRVFKSEVLAYEKGWLIVSDIEDGYFKHHRITHSDVIEAWQKFSTDKRHIKRFKDVILDNINPTTGQYFIELCCFKEGRCA